MNIIQRKLFLHDIIYFFPPINSNLYHYAGNNPIKYTDPDGRDVNPSNMGLKPEIRQKMNSLKNLENAAKNIKISQKSNNIDLKLSHTSNYCWARASVIREELERMGYDVDGYTVVNYPLKYEAKQKVKNGELEPTEIPVNDGKNRFGYHVGVTVKIDGELYVVDPFYDEHSPGLSKQEDWINAQYGTNSNYQKKDSKYDHLDAFYKFHNSDSRKAYEDSVKELEKLSD